MEVRVRSPVTCKRSRSWQLSWAKDFDIDLSSREMSATLRSSTTAA
jgi:hypothetical protein